MKNKYQVVLQAASAKKPPKRKSLMRNFAGG